VKKHIFLVLLLLLSILLGGCLRIEPPPEPSGGLLGRTSNPSLKSGFRCTQYGDWIYYADKNQIIGENKNGSVEKFSIEDLPAGMTACGQGVFVYHKRDASDKKTIGRISQYDQNGNVIAQLKGVGEAKQLQATEHGLYFSTDTIVYYDGFHFNTPPRENTLDEIEPPFYPLSELEGKPYETLRGEILFPEYYQGPDHEILMIQRRPREDGLTCWRLFSESGMAFSGNLSSSYFLGINQDTTYELSDMSNYFDTPIYIFGTGKNIEKTYALPIGYRYEDAYLTDNQRIVVLGSKWEKGSDFSSTPQHLSDLLVEIDLTEDSVTTLLVTEKEERLLTYSGRFVYLYAKRKLIQTDLLNNSSETLHNFGLRKNIEFETCGGYLFSHSADGAFLFKTRIVTGG